MHFYLETEPLQRFTPEAAVFAEAVEQHNWLHPNERHDCIWGVKDPFRIMTLIHRFGPEEIVPVGSVEFVRNACTSFFDIPAFEAVNIPLVLRTEELLGRQVWDGMDIAGEKKICAQHGKVLVKPGKTIKRFEMTLDNGTAVFPEDEPLFVSQFLPHEITSEWRAFCLCGKVLSIHPYGRIDVWSCPDRKLVEKMARLTADICPASALDVAVLENGQTVIIEVHPFSSCGLYGFEGPDVLKMAAIAWRHHIRGVERKEDS